MHYLENLLSYLRKIIMIKVAYSPIIEVVEIMLLLFAVIGFKLSTTLDTNRTRTRY